MEESHTTIRDKKPEPPMALPLSWICDDDDRPTMPYRHEGYEVPFRIKVGATWYERFGVKGNGECLYRRVR